MSPPVVSLLLLIKMSYSHSHFLFCSTPILISNHMSCNVDSTSVSSLEFIPSYVLVLIIYSLGYFNNIQIDASAFSFPFLQTIVILSSEFSFVLFSRDTTIKKVSLLKTLLELISILFGSSLLHLI